MEITKTLHVKTRNEWRNWLKLNYKTEKEIWLIFHNKSSDKTGISYEDAVEEALCFGWIDSILNPDFGPGFPGVDKLAHFGFCAVAGFLCTLWRWESGRGAKGAFVFAAVLVVLLGAVDEIHQLWIPGRSMELLDWAADVAGGFAGAHSSLAAVSLFPGLITRENQSAPRALTD